METLPLAVCWHTMHCTPFPQPPGNADILTASGGTGDLGGKGHPRINALPIPAAWKAALLATDFYNTLPSLASSGNTYRFRGGIRSVIEPCAISAAKEIVSLRVG